MNEDYIKGIFIKCSSIENEVLILDYLLLSNLELQVLALHFSLTPTICKKVETYGYTS